MSEDLNSFKKSLDTLKTKKTEVSVKIQGAMKRSEELKAQLLAMGYENLQAAKDDYARRVAGVQEKQTQVTNYIKQITDVESRIPSRDEVLKRLRSSITSGSEVITPTESATNIAEPVTGTIGNPGIGGAFPNIEGLL